MALGLAADDVIVTPLADAGIAQVLVHDLAPGLPGQKLLLGVRLVTPTTSLVASQRLKLKLFKLAYVTNSSWPISSMHSRHKKLCYMLNRLRLTKYQP